MKVHNFVHPGIKVNVNYLEQFVRHNLHREPWKSASEKVLNDYLKRADKNWVPKPRDVVDCGAYSQPDCGCTDQTRDGQAAYAQALLWVIKDDKEYAATAIKILDAWSREFTGGHIGENARLQASWAACLFISAAEILAHTASGWTTEGKARFRGMLETQFQPIIEELFYGDGWKWDTVPGNWRSTGIEALLYIAIFTDNHEIFARSIQLWKDHIVASIYLESDGARPRLLPNWTRVPTDEEVNQQWGSPYRYIEGMNVESCRDFAHTAYGLAATINVAETALLQGIDLYRDEETQAMARMMQTMEFHSRYENIALMPDICERYHGIQLSAQWTFEIGYTHYAVRLGHALPETRAFVQRHRPTQGDFHYMWESLTHAYPRTGDDPIS
ncbi:MULTISPECIES: alginate lyase family protein [unclassified Pseudomonas]|uniref:alginate lyase family protein n=1 Tax=unclassified Pseudomonas TaxID=196821 RepID=UPI00224B53EC|nr:MULTISPECIES: alginate lyase family protein [unclassified Pseudomonas]MCX2889708.1 alginate lyase family protein [Pseudomonas sp. DCB_BI]MDH4553097.1 hypothetical protein [Pseudomonas sp. BN607]